MEQENANSKKKKSNHEKAINNQNINIRSNLNESGIGWVEAIIKEERHNKR